MNWTILQDKMTARKTFIIFVVVLITLLAILIAIAITFGAAMSWGGKTAIQTPVIRYYWLFNLFLLSLVVSTLAYASTRWESQKSLIPFVALFGATLLTLPAYYFGSKYKVDIPFSFYLNDDRYEIPWEFGPDANSDGRGSYIRIRTEYPGFSALVTQYDENGFETEGAERFRILAARANSPDILCVGGVGCTSVVGQPRSVLPVSQQLYDVVTEHIRISSSIETFQKAWVRESDKSTLYFYKKSPIDKQDIYGFCTFESNFNECAFLLFDGDFYYDISFSFRGASLEAEFKIEDYIDPITLGIKAMFDSFRR